ncbi:uncharacterized protein ARMOST_02075 [Armillaria ostoyae]|uniref:Uncharacterized protein n=1 Tax=Armillaria ostoyae TaxID=47428 RepID=A0A284QQQ4_ARMOS|nr:uncharacterized protein ARMOST_02075 [Armillaria ostoyae]
MPSSHNLYLCVVMFLNLTVAGWASPLAVMELSKELLLSSPPLVESIVDPEIPSKSLLSLWNLRPDTARLFHHPASGHQPQPQISHTSCAEDILASQYRDGQCCDDVGCAVTTGPRDVHLRCKSVDLSRFGKSGHEQFCIREGYI